MPNDPSPRRPGWRNAGRPSSALPKHGWQRGAADAKKISKSGWSLRSKFTLLGLGFVTLIGVIVGLILLIRPTPPPQLELLIADTGADLRVPGNPFASRAADQLAALAGEGLVGNEVPWTADGDPFAEVLQRCGGSIGHKPAEKVVLFLDAPGGADAQGPYWVPKGADPLKPDQLLHLGQLIDALSKLDKKTKKLVIVDSTQTMAHWPLGILHNDLAHQLEAHTGDIESVPNLVVLCASGPGQRSWVSEEWGQSVFMHYVLEGLGGAAGTKSGSVYAWNLFQYAHERVARWSIHNRAAYQEPILLGGQKRAEDMELLRPSQGGKTEAAANEQAPDVAGLTPLWQTRDDLAKAFPPPWVAAPLPWRRYLETLLRHEQLARAGVDDAATERDLQKQADQIRGLVNEAPKSVSLSLRGLAAFGQMPADKAKLAAEFDKLWTGDPDAAKRTLKGLADATGSDAARRAALVAMLVGRGGEGPESNFDKAADLLDALHDGGALLPPEAHFLRLLHANPRTGRAWTPVQHALRVRMQAEEAALGLDSTTKKDTELPAYSDLVRPWIQKDVEKADHARQLGQDLLFASDKQSWAEAEKLLTQAEKDYAAAQKTALAVREGLFARDQALTNLPYYSRWEAERREEDEGAQRIKQLETLWKNVHQLDSDLASGTNSDGIAKLAQTVRAELRALEHRFQDHCKRLAGSGGLQDKWHEIEAALLVPLLDAGTRAKLLAENRRISSELLAAFQPEKTRGGEDKDKEKEATVARRLAERQARLAAAVLDVKGIEGGRDLDEAYAGEKIAHQWAAMLTKVEDITRDAPGKPLLPSASSELVKAAQLARHFDGAAASYVTPLDPIQASRRLQLHDWLCWQAERTLRDHWYDSDGKTPYYRLAGRMFVEDAKRLALVNFPNTAKAEQQDQRLAPVKDLTARLEASGELSARWADGLTRLPLTDETDVKRDYSIELPVSINEGYPVVHIERGAGLSKAADIWAPREIKTGVKKLTGVDEFQPVPPPTLPRRPRADKSSHALRGFFRGQKFDAPTEVVQFWVPEITASQQRMPKGGIAVQASDQDRKRFDAENTAVAFVLDTSGSMRTGPGGFGEGKPGERRFDRALDALKTVLADFPPKLRVSLRIFANRKSSKLIWDKEEWDTGQVEAKVRELRKVYPDEDTPLVATMAEAARNDFPRGFAGNKIMVVLTDGGDSEVAPERVPAELAKVFQGDLKLGADTGFQVHVIGFEVIDKEERRISQKFKEGLEHVGGEYHDVQKGVDVLTRHLRASLRGLKYWLEDEARDRTSRKQGHVGDAEGEYQWVAALDPGKYVLQMRTQGKSGYVDRKVQIDRGDFLVLNLTSANRGFLFQRDLWARRYYSKLGRKPKGEIEDTSWLAAIHQNQHTSRDTLEMMATLEKVESPKFQAGEEGTPLQLKPGLVLFEIKADGFTEPLALRSTKLAGYPAPAWGLEVDDWPKENAQAKPPLLDVWWIDQHRANYQGHPYARILRPGEFTLNERNRPLDLAFSGGKQGLVLDSIGAETIQVGGKPEECLVVRLRYPPDQRYMVRLVNSPYDAVEAHRFFTAAGKYTGIFRSWTKDKLANEGRNLALEIISIDALKHEASGRGHALFKLGKPDTDPRPLAKAPVARE